MQPPWLDAQNARSCEAEGWTGDYHAVRQPQSPSQLGAADGSRDNMELPTSRCQKGPIVQTANNALIFVRWYGEDNLG